MSEENREKVSLGVQQPQQGQAATQQLWDVPVADVPLPSQGKVYPVESALHNRTSVEIKAMTAKEEDILTSATLIRQGKVMTQLLRSCLVDKSIDPDEMIVGDRNAILVAIRASGYGTDYLTEVTCEDCGEAFEHTFTLNNLPIAKLSQDPDVEGTRVFSFVLPVSKKTVKFKLLSGAEELELSNVLEKTKKVRGPGSVENHVTARLFYSIMSIDGENDRAKIQRLVQTMPAMDAKKLRNYMVKLQPGLDLVQEVVCPACNASSEVDMPIGQDFFWPDLE